MARNIRAVRSNLTTALSNAGQATAIGLSARFVEPLESTGIHFIQYGIGTLADALQGCVYDDQRIAGYNRSVTAQMEDTRDFLTLHYALTSG
jgi:tryptophan halogenase